MLRANNISVGYGKTCVLEGLSLSIASQEIHVLMGVNGSGKSSLLKAFAGSGVLKSGEIYLNGCKLKSFSPKKLAREISFLESQNQVVFPMTVIELLNLTRHLHDDPSIYSLAIEALDLQGFEKRNLLELSSGELKRAFIAHTLCTKAKIILLDEPLAHLDWRHQNLLVRRLKEWRDRFATTFVLAIHELEWIPKIADQVTALGRRSILAQGLPSHVLQSPAVSEVFAFKACIDQNPIDGQPRLTLGHDSHDPK